MITWRSRWTACTSSRYLTKEIESSCVPLLAHPFPPHRIATKKQNRGPASSICVSYRAPRTPPRQIWFFKSTSVRESASPALHNHTHS